jgi:hypothetical protein
MKGSWEIGIAAVAAIPERVRRAKPCPDYPWHQMEQQIGCRLAPVAPSVVKHLLA